MAKRFTDTKKWEDPWFFALSPDDKCLWYYLLDKCDYAGIWNVNLPLASVFLKREILEQRTLEVFNEKIRVFGNRWFIPKFITFQYGVLNPRQVMHRRVILTLETLEQGLSKGYLTRQEKEQEQELKLNTKEYIEIINDLNIVCNCKYLSTGAKTRVLIKARMEEGHSIQDFKKVHRKKQKEWGDDPKMKKYLRPETLYSQKFDRYLNEPEPEGRKVWE